MFGLAFGLVGFVGPSKVDAYGAPHVGYTRVGPNRVYHTSATAYGPGGAYAGLIPRPGSLSHESGRIS